jgi:hypothetical protein
LVPPAPLGLTFEQIKPTLQSSEFSNLQLLPEKDLADADMTLCQVSQMNPF